MTRFVPEPNAATPIDVPAMNAAALVLALLGGVVLLAALAVWAVRQPVFNIRTVRIEGDVARNSPATLRANTLPALRGNFFTLDLAAVRNAFEAVPWVRKAFVNRLWPDRVVVRLEEHRAAALWGRDSDLLVNSHGEVFAANVGDVEDQNLPTLVGPDGSEAQMLALLRGIEPALVALDAKVSTLTLSGRGSWAVLLDTGARLELGRGGEEELVQRTRQFVMSVGSVLARYERALLYADLRHHRGYAVRLNGISTVLDAADARK